MKLINQEQTKVKLLSNLLGSISGTNCPHFSPIVSLLKQYNTLKANYENILFPPSLHKYYKQSHTSHTFMFIVVKTILAGIIYLLSYSLALFNLLYQERFVVAALTILRFSIFAAVVFNKLSLRMKKMVKILLILLLPILGSTILFYFIRYSFSILLK